MMHFPLNKLSSVDLSPCDYNVCNIMIIGGLTWLNSSYLFRTWFQKIRHTFKSQGLGGHCNKSEEDSSKLK